MSVFANIPTNIMLLVTGITLAAFLSFVLLLTIKDEQERKGDDL